MMFGSSARIVLLLMAAVLVCEVCWAEESEKVRILFLGEVAWSNQLFLEWISVEPSFALTTVPCDLQWVSFEEATRFARIYLPRTQYRLRNDYEVFIFEDFSPEVLPIAVLNWIQAGVQEGMGIALIEFAYWGGSNEIPKWMDLSFYEVFPASVLLNVIPASSGRTFYDVQNEDGPLGLPGIESVPMNQGYHGDLSPRLGATVEALWKVRQRPAMVTSKYGEGHTLQLDHGWDNIPSETRFKYEYMPDYIYNHVFYIAGIRIPEDIELVRMARASLIAYASRRKATLAIFDFVEKFGANPSSLSRRLDEMDSRQVQASQLYLAQEYAQVEEVLSQLISEFSELDAELMRARDRAFFWMYVVEWTSIAGASVLCGTTLWSLMIRRKLYRPAGATRSV